MADVAESGSGRLLNWDSFTPAQVKDVHNLIRTQSDVSPQLLPLSLHKTLSQQLNGLDELFGTDSGGDLAEFSAVLTSGVDVEDIDSLVKDLALLSKDDSPVAPVQHASFARQNLHAQQLASHAVPAAGFLPHVPAPTAGAPAAAAAAAAGRNPAAGDASSGAAAAEAALHAMGSLFAPALDHSQDIMMHSSAAQLDIVAAELAFACGAVAPDLPYPLLGSAGYTLHTQHQQELHQQQQALCPPEWQAMGGGQYGTGALPEEQLMIRTTASAVAAAAAAPGAVPDLLTTAAQLPITATLSGRTGSGGSSSTALLGSPARKPARVRTTGGATSAATNAAAAGSPSCRRKRLSAGAGDLDGIDFTADFDSPSKRAASAAQHTGAYAYHAHELGMGMGHGFDSGAATPHRLSRGGSSDSSALIERCSGHSSPVSSAGPSPRTTCFDDEWVPSGRAPQGTSPTRRGGGGVSKGISSRRQLSWGGCGDGAGDALMGTPTKSSRRSLSVPDIPLPPPRRASRGYCHDVACHNCGKVASTPQMRRGPAGNATLCNACGSRLLKGAYMDQLATSMPDQYPVDHNAKVCYWPGKATKPADMAARLPLLQQVMGLVLHGGYRFQYNSPKCTGKAHDIVRAFFRSQRMQLLESAPAIPVLAAAPAGAEQGIVQADGHASTWPGGAADAAASEEQRQGQPHHSGPSQSPHHKHQGESAEQQLVAAVATTEAVPGPAAMVAGDPGCVGGGRTAGVTAVGRQSSSGALEQAAAALAAAAAAMAAPTQQQQQQ